MFDNVRRFLPRKPEDEQKTEYIQDELVKANTGNYYNAVRWMRGSLKSQARFLRRQRNRTFRRAYWTQLIVIVLGFVASLAAIFSQQNDPKYLLMAREYWVNLNIIVPLVISSLSAALALMDFRGAFARNSAAFSILAGVKSDIDYTILMGSEAQPPLDDKLLNEWNRITSAAMAEWERSATTTEKKN